MLVPITLAVVALTGLSPDSARNARTCHEVIGAITAGVLDVRGGSGLFAAATVCANW